MKHVLVVFQAEDAVMEALALGAAFGAYEAGAKVQLRQLRSAERTSGGPSECADIEEKDLAWADGVIVGIQDRTSLRELRGLPGFISRMSLTSNEGDKWAYIFSDRRDDPAIFDSVMYMQDEFLNAGFHVNTDPVSSSLTAGLMHTIGNRLAHTDGRNTSE